MADLKEKKIGRLTVQIDREKCIASANCVQVGAEVFELDGEGIVTFRDEDEPIPEDELIEACKVCPVEALSAVDEDGKQRAP
ncbi:MAG: ferredoxin [Acidobacteriota bacterium]|nr:ferredoxin [Acidobacteriota bacterium]